MSQMNGMPRTGLHLPGLYYGRVTNVTAVGLVYLTISRNTGPREVGPCEMCEFPGTPGITTDITSLHSHAVRPAASRLKVGDRVLVGFIEGSPDHPVIVGRLPAG